MASARPSRTHLRDAALAAALVALTSQISINLFTGDFKISVAIILLPMFAFLLPSFPLPGAALMAAPGVFILRVLVDRLSAIPSHDPWAAYAPELIFYLSYGFLLALYLKKVPLHPYQLIKFLPLMLIDAAANFLELLVRLGSGVFAGSVLLQLALVGVCRALLAAAVIRALDYYGFQVLRREDAERYRRLLLLTASLKSEVAWMDKGTTLIEDTMNAAYQLSSQLRRSNAAPPLTDAALNIAKDIHEVKKEYFLIMRGISQALDSDILQGGMWLGDLFEVMGSGVAYTAAETGKQVRFSSRLDDNFYTRKHHYLMSILHNLLGNAVEAAKPGVPVCLTLLQYSDGTDDVFQVRDTCGGIPPDLLDQIFVAGFSSKINRTTGEVNRGLGLCIVKDLVEHKLQGTIDVSTAEGGTLFTIRAPKTGLEGLPDEVLPG